MTALSVCVRVRLSSLSPSLLSLSLSHPLSVCVCVPTEPHNKLSCRRETARCLMSLNISLSHSVSLKVTRNDTLENGVNNYWYFIANTSVSRTVAEMISIT